MTFFATEAPSPWVGGPIRCLPDNGAANAAAVTAAGAYGPLLLAVADTGAVPRLLSGLVFGPASVAVQGVNARVLLGPAGLEQPVASFRAGALTTTGDVERNMAVPILVPAHSRVTVQVAAPAAGVSIAVALSYVDLS